MNNNEQKLIKEQMCFLHSDLPDVDSHSEHLSLILSSLSRSCHFSSAATVKKARMLRSGEDTSESSGKSEFCALTTSSHFPDRQVDYPHFTGKVIKIRNFAAQKGQNAAVRGLLGHCGSWSLHL